MIGYVTLGTNDLEKACAFYDEVLGLVGAKRFMSSERSVYWGKSQGRAMLGVLKPYDQQPATVGNGVMVALGVRGKELVDSVHAKAMELGAPDEGAPGLRGEEFYGAYFRDRDGNKVCVFTFLKSQGE